jgi:predicted RND superfamily exporter protein
MRQEIDRERKERENEIRRMKQQNERERIEKENTMRIVKQKEEQIERERMEKENAIQLMLSEVKQKEEHLERERKDKDREIAELKNQLSRASLLTSQVNHGIFLSRFTVMSKVLLYFHSLIMIKIIITHCPSFLTTFG